MGAAVGGGPEAVALVDSDVTAGREDSEVVGVEYLEAVAAERLWQWSNKWFRSCNRNSNFFFRDLILMEISELDGIVRFVVRPVCKQFRSCLCAFNIRTRCRLIS